MKKVKFLKTFVLFSFYLFFVPFSSKANDALPASPILSSETEEYSALESVPGEESAKDSLEASPLKKIESNTTASIEPTLTIEHKAPERIEPTLMRNSNWAIAIDGSPDAFGQSLNFESLDSETLIKPRASKVGLKLNKVFEINRIGALSFGPIGGIYVLRNKGNLKTNPLSLWSTGAEASLQIKPFERQWFVPYITGELQAIRTQISNIKEPNSWSQISGTGAGFLINLNQMDEDSAIQFYGRTGIQKTYFSLEWKRYESKNDRFSTHKGPHLFGSLRVEL